LIIDPFDAFTERFETPPELIDETVNQIREAGVGSIILCREHQEISLRSMCATHRAQVRSRG
jgi:hypothetical protein